MVAEHNLNRVVVASCTPRTHEPIFQDTLREAGLNPFLFEMANIRDQASWVHRDQPEKATGKAKDLIRMSVARARLLEPLYKVDVPLTHTAVVVGGGVAGMTAAAALGDMGHEVHLVERDAALGGRVLELDQTIKGSRPGRVRGRPRAARGRQPQRQDPPRGELDDFHGFIGNFSSVIAAGRRQAHAHRPRRRDRRHRLARGSVPSSTASARATRSSPAGPRAAASPTDQERLAKAGAVGFILCAGSLDEKAPVLLAHLLPAERQERHPPEGAGPERPVYVWFKEVRTFGLFEEYYTRARELGVIFTRYDNDSKPEIVSAGTAANGKPARRSGRLHATPTCSAASSCPSTCSCWPPRRCPTRATTSSPRCSRCRSQADGFFLEAHVKLRPVDFASEGIFLCGAAHYPKCIDESISQAYAAAGRAAAILAKPALKAGGVVAEVDQDKCAACLTCVRVCPYEVPIIDPVAKKAEIEAAACQGCGVCVSECPAKAIVLHHYTDAQIFAKEEALTMEVS